MSADPNAPSAFDLDDEPYESAEDEDFQLDPAQDESGLSSSEDESAEPAKKKRKTDKKSETVLDELDSGDEATIQKARDKRNKSQKKKAKGKNAVDEEDLDFDEDEGGAGGFVRTRAMKKHIQEEKRNPLARIDGATVDVDALWAQMNAPESQLGLQASQIENKHEPTPDESDGAVDTNAPDKGAPEPEDSRRHGQYKEQMVKIKRTYKFAGEMITEEKVVPKDSAEAKAFLSSGEAVEFTEVEDANGVTSNRNLRRPLRKISRFDPNPTGLIKKSWEKQPIAENTDAAGPKINTVEKSRLDWAQYVDQAGIKDELRTASKAKEGYMGRMDFLGRMESKRDEEARQARLRAM
ncbi:SWR1-complex protein 5 [Penicillium rolfsii]|nr:SWR1-complex protein 5 [Penicillium rolfsii]